MDLPKDSHLIYIAKEGLKAPLPDGYIRKKKTKI
jgi:hypothetical protein